MTAAPPASMPGIASTLIGEVAFDDEIDRVADPESAEARG